MVLSLVTYHFLPTEMSGEPSNIPECFSTVKKPGVPIIRNGSVQTDLPGVYGHLKKPCAWRDGVALSG